MEVGSTGSPNVASASPEAQVNIQKKSQEQEKTVVSTILNGATSSTPRAAEQTGQNLDLTV